MLIDHVIARETTYPGMAGFPTPGKMYEIVYAANGVWIRARREGLAAQIPLVLYPNDLKMPGLMNAQLVVSLEKKIGPDMLNYLVQKSRENIPNEVLYYLTFFDHSWRLYIPTQITNQTACMPVDGYGAGSILGLVEVHSHNIMPAFFSKEDDRDEQGFRIYVVLGRLQEPRPQILVRVGIYGFRAVVPAGLVFKDIELVGVEDVYDRIR